MTPRLRIASEQMAALLGRKIQPPVAVQAERALAAADALLAEHKRTSAPQCPSSDPTDTFDCQLNVGHGGDHLSGNDTPQADSAGLLDTHNYRNEYNALIQLIAEQTYAVGIGETMTAEDRVRRVCDRIRELDKRVSKEVEAREFWFRKYHNGRSDDDEWRSFSPESRGEDASVLRVPTPAGALAGDQQADRRAGGADGGDATAGAGDDGGVAEAARSEGLLRSGSSVAAQPGIDEIPERVVEACARAIWPNEWDMMSPWSRQGWCAKTRDALREYDRQMPALRGRVLDTALCCVSPQGRVIGVYQQRHFAEEAATVCGGTVHRVALVEMGEDEK